MNEGLEKLKTIRHIHDMECGEDERINKDFDIIEKELKESENYKVMYRLEHEKNQQLTQANLKISKALEIIKEKAVNVLMFKAHFIISKPEYEEYQYYLDNCEKYGFSAFYLTRQEFDLLKEALL